MSYSESDLWNQLRRADAMEFGEAEQALLEEVVRHADAQGFARLAFTARRNLASAYSVDRQWHKAFPLFSRCLSEYDERPWQFGPEEEWQLRHWYTSIARSMAEFPEITLAQIYGAFTDMERRFTAGGHNLRDVYAARRWVAQLACDWDEEERCYHQWLAAGGPRPGSVWEFEAGIERLVFRGDPESEAKALELARPVLEGRMTFNEPPAPIQRLMLIPLVRNGEYDEAALAYRRSLRTMNESVYRYEYGGMGAEFCALTGNKDRGLVEIRRRLLGFPTLNRPSGRMEFAAAAAVVLQQFDPGTEGTELIGYGMGEEPSISINQLRQDMTNLALDLADKFDNRNGTTHQGDRIRAKLEQKPLTDFVALTPTSRPQHRVVISPDLSPNEILDRAEWHYRGYEYDLTRQYVAGLPQALPPALEARVTQLRALLDGDGDTEQALRSAAEQHRQLGDHRRFLLCLCELALMLSEKPGRGQEAYVLCVRAVRQLYELVDKWAMAWGELRLSQVMVSLEVPGEYDAIQRGINLATELNDTHSLGIMNEICICWHEWDQSEPDVVINMALSAKDNLLASGAAEKSKGLFRTMKKTFRRAGNPQGFVEVVRTQLNELPEQTADEARGYLRYERGVAALHEGHPTAALPDLTEGVAQLHRHQHDQAEQWFYLAQAAYLAGQTEQALEAADQAAVGTANSRNKNALEDPVMADQAQLILARSYRDQGLTESAFEAFDQLLKQAREFDSLIPLAEGLADSAELLAQVGNYREAVSRLDEAAALHDALGNQAGAHHCQAIAQQLRPQTEH